MNIKRLLLLGILFISFSGQAMAEGFFFTGLGYIQPQNYRKDNEVNPLPFGLSVFPIIAYQSRSLRVYGPFVSYALLSGPIGFNINVRVAGDNYEAHNLEPRKTGVNAGASLRLLYLTLGYGSDVSGRYRGNMLSVSLGNRFVFGNGKLALIPRVARQFVNKSFTNYYYGVSEDEVGEFSEYSLNEAANTIYALNANYNLNEREFLTLNSSYKIFDPVIADSPTVALSQYTTWSIFYNYKL